jgi:hypothetical protein
MRSFTPGAAPFSGQAKGIHEKIGDYMHSESFKWSCVPNTGHRPNWPALLGNMQRCEQQNYLVIDDAWGVLVDLAGLIRARQKGFTARRAARADDWATAGMLKSLSESDNQLKSELPGITRYRQLVAIWQEQESEQTAYDDDLRRLATNWVDWFASMAQQGPASLDTACGHFDISQPMARSELETSFAAACLGPSATSLGAKAIEQALTPSGQAGSPWLLWALLGVSKRLSPGEIKLLLHVVESSADVMPDTAALSRAVAFSLALNQSVEKLLTHKPAQAMEAFSVAVAPAAGGGLNRLMQQADDVSMLYLVSSLARSNQRMTVDQASPREVGLWVSRVMGSKPLTAPKRAGFNITPIATGVSRAQPFFCVVAAPATAPAHPQPGYGSNVPPGGGSKPANLPPIQKPEVTRLPSIDEMLEKAPLKTLIFLVAAVNLVWVGNAWADDRSLKNVVGGLSGLLGTVTAYSAVRQKVAEVNWSAAVKSTGSTSASAHTLLVEALGLGAATSFLQGVTASIDTVYFGVQALESFRANDYDHASVSLGQAVGSAALARVSLQLMQTYRAAQAAALLGNAVAVAEGVAVAPTLQTRVLALAITLCGLALASLYTKDSPVAAWVKGTRFGNYPQPWAKTHNSTMLEYYRVVMPVKMNLERWQDINPRGSQWNVEWRNEVRLYLRLPGQHQYRQGMLSFHGQEDWVLESASILDFKRQGICKPLVWAEDQPIPFDPDTGSRLPPEPDGSLRLRRAYHLSEGSELAGVKGTLIYQPIDGLYLPPIEIEVS